MNYQTRPRVTDASFANDRITRRAVLRGGALLLGGLMLSRPSLAEDADVSPIARFGITTDIHHADLPNRRARHYRQALDKLRVAVDAFNDENPDYVVQMGDVIDRRQADAQIAVDRLGVVEAALGRLRCDRHYVIGNHCAAWLTQAQLVEHCGAVASYYSFDVERFHFVVVDSCYTRDGKPFHADLQARYFIPEDQRRWLADDLAKTDKPTIVLAHQPLGGSRGRASVQNADDIRNILTESGKVLAVFQGHIHRNDYAQLHGIHYCSLAALVDGSGQANNSYGIVSLYEDGSIRIQGFHQMQSRDMKAAAMEPA